MPRCLVTGGTGFIGANLVHQLLKENYKIYLIVEKKSNFWRLKDIISSINIFEINLIEFEKIDKLIKEIKPEVIFHLASYGGFPHQKSQKEIFDVNLYGTINLINSCKKVGFDCFVNTGSSSEYGIKNSEMKENNVLEPVSDYGVSKAASTQFCLKEALFNKLPIYTVRPFSVYGDYEYKERLIPHVLINALQNKIINLSSLNFVRDFIYVQDIVDFYIKLSKIKPENDFIFNAGTGIQSSIGDVVAIVQNILNKNLPVNCGKSEIRPWEPKVWKACINKAKKILNWEPQYSLKKGLKSSLNWFEQNLKLYENNFIALDKSYKCKYKYL